MPPPVADVSDAQPDQVTGSKLAVDGEVEQRQLAVTIGELQADPNRPDLFELKRRFLTYKLSPVPGFANGCRSSERVPWAGSRSCRANQFALGDNGRFVTRNCLS